MKKYLLQLFYIACSFADSSQLIDLDRLIQDFVLETKRIEIPEYPHAFNASLLRWNGYFLMSFRVIPDPKTPFTSLVGIALFDETFHCIGTPQILNVREEGSTVPPRVDDARLIYVGEEVYLVYSDNPHSRITRGGFRMVIGKLVYENGLFSIQNSQRLMEFDGQSESLREKNWVPFDYGGKLMLSYSICPHIVFFPIPSTPTCEKIADTPTLIYWDWGIVRGGTPAIHIDTGEYLSFFHSVKKMASENSMGKEAFHYYIGAYTFSDKPPFHVTQFSSLPIVGEGFYSGAEYQPYWASIQCVFPMGLIDDGDTLLLSYGRQDHEIWVAKIHKQNLLNSLSRISISTGQSPVQ